MAFKLNKPKEGTHLVPSSLDGLYLLPYSWLKWGLDNGTLEIEDNAFYDTVQGSLYLQLLDEGVYPKVRIDGKVLDVWYVYYPGRGVAFPVCRGPQGSVITELHGTFLKQDVKFTDVCDLIVMSPAMQKTVNNSIIQLMKGCHIKLKRSVWC